MCFYCISFIFSQFIEDTKRSIEAAAYLGIPNIVVHSGHVKDNLGFLDDHIMPFLGTLNVDSLMQGLLDIGYNGYFTFEADSTPLSPSRRNVDKRITKFTTLPLEFGRKFEALLYETGKYLLTEYNCFEE